MELAPKLQDGSRWLHHGEDAWDKARILPDAFFVLVEIVQFQVPD